MMNNNQKTFSKRDACYAEFRSPDGYRKLYELDKLQLSIGSHSSADISFPGLSFQHAELCYQSSNWIIRKNNADAFVEFRNYPIVLKKLNPEDHINLGVGTLIFRRFIPDKNTGMTDLICVGEKSGLYKITILNGAEKGRTVDLYPGEYTLGRKEHSDTEASSNRIEFINNYVSRNHARLYVEKHRIRVEDLNSTNGIRINRTPQTTGELKTGDKLRLGKLKLGIMGPSNHIRPTQSVSLNNMRLKRIIQRLFKLAVLIGIVFTGIAVYRIVLY
jgi:hypothetical protein